MTIQERWETEFKKTAQKINIRNFTVNTNIVEFTCLAGSLYWPAFLQNNMLSISSIRVIQQSITRAKQFYTFFWGNDKPYNNTYIFIELCTSYGLISDIQYPDLNIVYKL